DASTRVKSFLKLKKLGLAEKDYPEVRKVSIWLDDHLWKPSGYISIRIATHKGWVTIEIKPHRQYWRYINRGWKLVSEAKIKLDKRNRQLVIYLTFVKEVEEYKPRDYLSVDVNESNVTVLVDGVAYLFETNTEKLVLGYHYHRKRIQEKYDRLYGRRSRIKRKAMRKLKEREKKHDIRWKIANIIVKTASCKQYAIVLEKLGRRSANNMTKRVKDKQLRHRIFQANFRGIQRAIEEKAREYGVPVIYVNPRNTSNLSPIHGASITYSDGSRIGKCSKGGELWHRDAVACWNLLLKALRGDGSNALSPVGRSSLDASRIPFGTNATHDPITLSLRLWARRKSLPQIQHAIVLNKMKR
ncbi:MAG: transposase, partial [Desulfurococcales archaeon]|nr:transposase [Desulfurococcales archaeon]